MLTELKRGARRVADSRFHYSGSDDRLAVMNHLALLGLAASLCSATGCYLSHNTDAEKTVRKLAAFESSCPAEDITLTRLDDSGGVRKLSTQIGASGCGKKSVYVYLVSTDTWVSNSNMTAEIIENEEAYQRAVQAEQQQQDQLRRQQQQ